MVKEEVPHFEIDFSVNDFDRTEIIDNEIAC